MDELSLNILDIAYNSIRAHASLIKIEVLDSSFQNKIIISIEDNGDGMSEEVLKGVANPFYTTRKTRKVGLGISLLKQSAELTDGDFTIDSTLGEGTKVTAAFVKNHIDTPIMGDLVETMMTLIQADDQIDYLFIYQTDTISFTLDTREIKEILGDVKITEPEIVIWLKEYMKEGMGQ